MNQTLQAVAADHLSESAFSRLSELIQSTVGIKLPPAKRMMVESRLRKRLRDIGQPSFEAYGRFLFDEGGLEQEMVHVIDAITTNKTDFFREPEHLDLLRDRLVDELVRARRSVQKPRLKIWSAASSNGAEAYSIAMVLSELEARRGDFHYAILGTDISTAVLRHARLAVYAAEAVAPVPPLLRERYVLHGMAPQRSAEVRMAPEIRRRCQFERMNLMDGTYPVDHDVDVIFLRNVLIYFDKSDQEAVIGRLLSHLRPHGFLVVGHSESMCVVDPGARQVAAGIFQKS